MWFVGILPSTIRKEFIENAGIPGVIRHTSGVWKEVAVSKDTDKESIKDLELVKTGTLIRMTFDQIETIYKSNGFQYGSEV